MSAPEGLLRDMVREILRDLVGEPGALPGTGAEHDRPGVGEVVKVAGQADLDQALRRLSADAAARAAFDRGELRFDYVAAAGGSAAPTPAPPAGAHRVERGALTERIVNTASRSGGIIEIARGVVVTPLARDRARALGVSIHQDQE